jgi:hypothetical protein
VTTYAYKKGMPNERFTFVPHPVTGVPAAVCRKYLEGNDPVTGKPVLQEILAALTTPLSEEDKKTGFITRPTQRLVNPDTAENLNRLFLENGWTDGLPIVLPTEARVAEMLKGTSRRPNEEVGKMQPSSPHEAWSYTAEQVAVNAVMAGAGPEHFPVILALASTGVPSLFTSTTSFARMVVVNGPIRNELKMNAGIGALGPFNYANSVIGRAWTLLSMNLSGSGKIGETYMGSQGNNYNYNNLCMPENEEELPPGWNPFHVQKGHKAQESVVSTFNGWGFTHPDQSFGKPFHIQIPFWLKFVSPFSPVTLLLDPTIIKQLKEREGFDSKEQLIDWIYKNTSVTVSDFLDNFYSVQNFILPGARLGAEPFASRIKLPREAKIPQFASPNVIHVLSVGGQTNLFWQAGDFGYISSASVDKWR